MARAAGNGLSDEERRALSLWARRTTSHRRVARRARIVLEWAEGRSTASIARRLGVSPETVVRWRDRFRANGVDGILKEAPRAGARARLPRDLIERILRATLEGAGPGKGAWSTRSLGRALGTNHMAIHRVWHAYGLVGPQSEAGAGDPRRPPRVDLAGAYTGPEAAAIIFSVDESSDDGNGVDALAEPDPPEDGGSPGPASRATELMEALRQVDAHRGVAVAPAGGPSRTAGSGLLVLLRSIEKRTPRTMRLDAVFDRPVEEIGGRLSRWLETHPRFRVYPTGAGDQWSRSTERWLGRWEGSPLDPRSFQNVPALRRHWAAGISGGRSGASFPIAASRWARVMPRREPSSDPEKSDDP